MATYIFPWLNGAQEIVNPTITKHGDYSGEFIDNVSQGTFKANIRLEDSAGSKWRVELSGNTLPVDFSTEEIDIWIASNLIQYEVTDH